MTIYMFDTFFLQILLFSKTQRRMSLVRIRLLQNIFFRNSWYLIMLLAVRESRRKKSSLKFFDSNTVSHELLNFLFEELNRHHATDPKVHAHFWHKGASLEDLPFVWSSRSWVLRVLKEAGRNERESYKVIDQTYTLMLKNQATIAGIHAWENNLQDCANKAIESVLWRDVDFE